jgi:hypothetical protein
MRHPAVAEAASFAVPHPRLGEDVAAAVVLRPGVTVTTVELRRFLHDQIASFKVPRRIIVQDQLPKGATGKVLRRLLAGSLQESLAGKGQVAAPLPVKAKPDYSNLVIELTKLWERLLKITPISIDDDFFEKGGDSLLAMEMLAELDRLTGKAVQASFLLESPTIRQLADKLSKQENLRPENLVTIHSGGHLRPLVFFHGDYIWGGGPLSVGLANLLGPDQPLLVVVPHGADNGAIPDSIEAMAAERLPLILNAQPEGPYRLCGNCLGGIVAFELARMLIAAGKEVEMVFMIDPPTVSASRSVQLLVSAIRRTRPLFGPFVDRAIAWTWYRCAQAQRFRHKTWSKRWVSIRRAAAVRTRIRNGLVRWTATDKGTGGPVAVGDQIRTPNNDVTEKYCFVMANYVPKPLNVKVIYIDVDFGVGAWRRISPNIEIIKSTGTHTEPDIPALANHLRSGLHGASYNH